MGLLGCRRFWLRTWVGFRGFPGRGLSGHLGELAGGSCPHPGLSRRERGKGCSALTQPSLAGGRAFLYFLAAARDFRMTSWAASLLAQPVTLTHLPGSRSL